MNGNRIQIVRPWNIVSDPVGPGSQYPINITPPVGDNHNLIAKWLGVAKGWRILADLTFNGLPLCGTDDLIPSLMAQQGDNNERTIIRGIYGTYDDSERTALHPLYPFVQIEFGLGAADDFVPPDVKPLAGILGSGTLSPWMLIQVTPILADHASSHITLTSLNGVNVSPATATFCGYDVTLYENAEFTEFAGTIEIKPPDNDGFFPFRDADGLNPVWDINSGAQLIVPVPLT